MLVFALCWLAAGAVIYGLGDADDDDQDIFVYAAIIALWPFIAITVLTEMLRGKAK